MEHYWNDNYKKILECLKKTLSKCKFVLQNTTCTGLGLNSGLCGKAPSPNHLRHGTAKMPISNFRTIN